jgi:hypothetical protein
MWKKKGECGMQLTSKDQAIAFVLFMVSEANRHQDDIDAINVTVDRACRAFNIKRPTLSRDEKLWVEVGDEQIARGTLAGSYPRSDEGEL